MACEVTQQSPAMTCSIGLSPHQHGACTPGIQAEVDDSLHVLQGGGGLALVGKQKGDRFALHA